MQIQSSWRENLIKANQNSDVMSSLCLEKSQRCTSGSSFFFFSSNRRSVVLKLGKSWYETRLFEDQALIAALLNSLDILLFRSVIRYTADNC